MGVDLRRASSGVAAEFAACGACDGKRKVDCEGGSMLWGDGVAEIRLEEAELESPSSDERELCIV